MVFLTLLGALLLLALAQAVPALGAAADYTGGPQAGDYPLYVSNDHTVYALRFTAAAGTLLDAAGTPVATAGAQYYVKMRISPTAKPSGGTSRGFIWNATTQQWVQERADWSDFPVVTTGPGGAIAAGNTWWYFKFGDTTKPGATDSGTWYILVSLKPIAGADQTTQNNASPPAITITDMTGALNPGTLTSAFRVHNGAATTATDARRIEATNSGGTDVWSLSRTENNQVAQGYGSDATGDFELAVPVGRAFDAKIQNVIWPALASSFTGSLANVDIALGAADTTPPSAPTTLSATAGDGHVQLSWPAVADAASYTVYKWQAATPIGGSTNYTPQHMAVATVTTTTYDATGLTNGEEYFFEVRANDAATNVGQPTATQAATPKATSQLTLQTSANTVKWGGRATLTGELTDGAAPFTSGQQVRLESSYDGSSWTLLQLLDPNAPYAYGVAVQPTRKTVYRLVFEGDASHAAADQPARHGRAQGQARQAARPVQRQEGQEVHRLRRPDAQGEVRQSHGQDQVLSEEVRDLEAEEDRDDHEQGLQVQLPLLGEVLAPGKGQLEAGGLRGGDVQVRCHDLLAPLHEGQVGGDDPGCLMRAHGRDGAGRSSSRRRPSSPS